MRESSQGGAAPKVDLPRVQNATPNDIPKIVELLRFVAKSASSDYAFDDAHAWSHVTSIVCNGVCFVLTEGNEVIGVVMCGFIDIGFAQTRHLETHHFYVMPNARDSKSAKMLLDALDDYADQQTVTVIYHQMDYHSALNGEKNNSRSVERLFRMRGYEGPIDTATVRDDARRVGISYRYPPRT